jgi:hypothetical protein
MQKAKSKKISQQRCGPLPAIQRCGRLAFRLDNPKHWEDSRRFLYCMSRASPKEEGSFPTTSAWAAAGFCIRRRSTPSIRNREKSKRSSTSNISPTGRVRYLVRWKGYGPEDDQMVSTHKASECHLALRLRKDLNPLLYTNSSRCPHWIPFILSDSEELKIWQRMSFDSETLDFRWTSSKFRKWCHTNH